MAMGFNTEIKHKGVVYHVQTEPRKDLGVETTVFIRGAIIHSLMTSCRDLASLPDRTEQVLTQKLEEQHRQVIAKIRAGEICFSTTPSAET